MKRHQTTSKCSRRAGRLACGIVLLMFLTTNEGGAKPIELSPQLITLPVNASESLFVDINGNGRSDLLALDPVEKRLFNYRQRANGFTNSPDQIISLPAQTAWVAPGNVDPHPGLELLMSTAKGLVYLRQNGGLFQSKFHALIETNQVFTNRDFPVLTQLTTNKAGIADFIPMIPSGRAVLYLRSRARAWNPGPPLTLDVEHTAWSVNQRWPDEDSWTLGPNAAHSWQVWQSFTDKSHRQINTKPEDRFVRKMMRQIKGNDFDRLDVNGDGRRDLVLWHVSQRLDFKTDIYIFLRGANQQLPERPTQILHCRGLPIPLGSEYMWSPVHDLNGDGKCELVLVELKTHYLSASGLLDTALSHGLDWSLTIRSFHHGSFSRRPDASVPITAILPANILQGWPLFIDGDFNGDGRPDFLVRRSETRWEIYCSTTDGRWFAREPTMAFDAPAHGHMKIEDLNGRGLSDIVWRERDRHRLYIFRSPAHRKKVSPP